MKSRTYRAIITSLLAKETFETLRMRVIETASIVTTTGRDGGGICGRRESGRCEGAACIENQCVVGAAGALVKKNVSDDSENFESIARGTRKRRNTDIDLQVLSTFVVITG